MAWPPFPSSSTRWRTPPRSSCPARRTDLADPLMSDPVDQLVTEITAATGAPPPAVMDAEAPIPADTEGELYYVGLIGGKDVGKTSLVNAIAGTTIAEPTGHGEGTRVATAYAHAAAADQVRRKLGD